MTMTVNGSSSQPFMSFSASFSLFFRHISFYTHHLLLSFHPASVSALKRLEPEQSYYSSHNDHTGAELSMQPTVEEKRGETS